MNEKENETNLAYRRFFLEVYHRVRERKKHNFYQILL